MRRCTLTRPPIWGHDAQAVVLSYREIDGAYVRRNLGVVVTVAVLYGAFLLGLALLRLRRTRQSLEYLRCGAGGHRQTGYRGGQRPWQAKTLARSECLITRSGGHRRSGARLFWPHVGLEGKLGPQKSWPQAMLGPRGNLHPYTAFVSTFTTDWGPWFYAGWQVWCLRRRCGGRSCSWWTTRRRGDGRSRT
jgi:hypothetical protein